MHTRRAAVQPSQEGERGYAMAALLVGLFVMGVLATVAMPVWTQAARREKEAELVFRGEQYARAVGLFQRKMGPGTLPPNLDLLVGCDATAVTDCILRGFAAAADAT